MCFTSIRSFSVSFSSKTGLIWIKPGCGLDEGRDRNAWIDLDIHLTDQLSLEEIHRLRKAHPGFIHIRPVFEEKETENDRIEVKHTSIEDSSQP